jgi:hypothetical protein
MFIEASALQKEHVISTIYKKVALIWAAESLAAALEARNVDVVRVLSYEDGHGTSVRTAKPRMRRQPRCCISCASGMLRRWCSSSRTASAPGAP